VQVGFGLANTSQADFAAEDSHGFKKRRGVFAAADATLIG